MKRPAPKPGLVIRYDYLWRDEARRGQAQGSKDRPCAVLIAVPKAGDDTDVFVCAITHVAPVEAGDAVPIPPRVGHALGLDGEQSWIVTRELNRLRWSDPGIVPALPDKWEYGRLPKALFDKVVQSLTDNVRREGAQVVGRDPS